MGETATLTADDERASVKRKDSGMSGMDPKTPEAATPKTRDFATIKTNNNHNVRNEKHDTRMVDKGSKSVKAVKFTAGVLGENKDKENVNMLRRMKNMALAPLHIGAGKA